MKNTILVLLVCFFALSAEDTDTSSSAYSKSATKQYSHYLGAAAGITAGFGLSYRHWFKSPWGFQINVLPIYTESRYPEDDDEGYATVSRDSGYYDKGYFSFGILVLRRLVDLRYLRFLLYAGANDLCTYKKYDYYTSVEKWDPDLHEYITVFGNRYTGKKVRNRITAGLGAGSEWYVWRFAFHVMLGLSGGYTPEIRASNLSPTVEGGIHFRL